jgi:serine phosphatase RsbU (regulator of sigma subunit)
LTWCSDRVRHLCYNVGETLPFSVLSALRVYTGQIGASAASAVKRKQFLPIFNHLNPRFVHMIFFLLGFSAYDAVAETREELDSLKKLLQTTSDPRDRGGVMLELSSVYSAINIDSAILYAEGAYQLAMTLKDLSFQSKVCCVLGTIYQNEDEVKSTEYIFKGLDLAELSGDSSQVAYTYNIVGTHYRIAGDMDKAIDFFNRAIAIRLAQQDSSNVAVCYNNIGIVYMIKGEYDTGIKFWEKSLELKLATGQEIPAAHTMSNIAIYYKDIDRIFEALDYTNKSIEIQMRLGDYRGVSHGYGLLGDIYSKTENWPKAIEAYHISVAYCDSINSEFEKIEPVYGLAFAQKNNGQYLDAFNTLDYYCYLYKKFNDEEIEQISADMQTRYETEKKEKENLVLKNQNDTKDLKLKEEEKRTLLLLIGLSVAVVLIIFIFLVLRRVRQAKLQVEEQKHIVEEKNKEITDSINYAKRIQAAILPSNRIVKEYLPDSFIMYKPKDIVAGDFYWMEKTKTALLVAAADCTGHGVPGAMVSVICNNGLNRAVREYGLTDPAKILDKTREIVISEFEKSDDEVKDGMDISLFALYPQLSQNGEQRIIVEWAGANNPLWVVRKGSAEVQEIKADKQPIGKFSESKPFTSHALDLRKGDTIYVFTDGYQDQFGGEKGKKFKAATLRGLLLENIEKSMPEQLKIVESAFEEWKGNLEQIDDVCLIGVRL